MSSLAMPTLTECPDCGGALTLVPNPIGHRTFNDPASRMKYVCADDDFHRFEDPQTMPVDHTRTITDR